ncbi:MAG: TIGR02117 family protein [Gammaproteobacteria bacterium]|nr:MAG: TIGR02117 family protein [Gammaproteobacteria bacterium]
MRNSLLLIVFLVLNACSGKPYVVETTTQKNPDGRNIISVVSHGWHTGFVVPADDITSKLPQLKQRFPDSPYLEFGWGDRGFYQAQEITSGLTLQAIFWPTESVMHVVALPELPQDYFPSSEVLDICLSDQHYRALLQFLLNSFFYNEQGQIIPQKTGLYGDSQFYTGDGDYFLFNTCNKWTAKGLKSAGMEVVPIFKLTATSVMNVIKSQTQGLRDGSGLMQGCF